MEKKILVSNIVWDTDGENIPELPEEVVIDNPTEEMLDGYGRADAISDYLSDTYEFCVVSFDVSEMASERYMEFNIRSLL